MYFVVGRGGWGAMPPALVQRSTIEAFSLAFVATQRPVKIINFHWRHSVNRQYKRMFTGDNLMPTAGKKSICRDRNFISTASTKYFPAKKKEIPNTI